MFPTHVRATGTGFAVLAVCVWILVWQAWQEIDPQDPGKKFAEEVAGTLHAGALRAAPAAAAFVQSLARRILRPKALHKKQSVSAEEKSTDASDLVHAARNGMG